MTQMKLPKGVEIHSRYLRISFQYKGKRCRETLGTEPTAKNIRNAGDMRAAIVFAIKSGKFDYLQWFPNSKNANKFGLLKQSITIDELCTHWLSSKKIEVTPGTLKNYTQRLKQMRYYIHGDSLVEDLSQSTILKLRDKFSETCRASTVNTYMRTVKSLISYAIDNKLCSDEVLNRIKELKQDKKKPNPITEIELDKIINNCCNQQDQNLWIFAIYTGLRHGEILALAWEDINFEEQSITISRSLTLEGRFKLPKNEHSERTVYLPLQALEALKSQKTLTGSFKSIDINVDLREIGRTKKYKITPVFSPKLTATRETKPYYYHTSINDKWKAVCNRAGVKYRSPYQTRHTYACMMLSSGSSPMYVANQMGHSSLKELDQTYGDWMPEYNEREIDKQKRANLNFKR